MQVASKCQEMEEVVDQIYMDIKEKHSDKYDVPKLHLWARMVSANLHGSIEEPPNVPAFGGGTYKKPRTSLSEAISGAAIAFAKVLGEKKYQSFR